ncbi:LuxE/PaaK family acyltransferase [Rhodohalobacter halophilus]|uniref:LuxE/PaaK family acyltransferase n=1 Tax=Rhodohalobacter halophilus TaxID=1812810 RepID=UPI00083F78E0|nr:hypothetical protein [Rhodohalobacter halophilus]
MSSNIEHKILDSSVSFNSRALSVFNFQRTNNPIYRTFCEVFGIKENLHSEQDISHIPLIPIRVFKERAIKSFQGAPDVIFQSSGTSNMERSEHHLKSADLYRTVIEKEFYRYFPKDKTTVLCYTPGYAENSHSSLIWMLNHLIEQDPTGLSRFLPLGKPLKKDLFLELDNEHRNVILFGAAFGLMDLIDLHSDSLPETVQIIETGGMKTHRRAITKSELRGSLSDGFKIPLKQIHSEYGMCELLSQSYAIGGEWFQPPEWVKIIIRDPKNPERSCPPGEEGKIGIIDLANLYSCSFILTDDRGVMNENGMFKVLGRWNDNDLRGCNFLVEQEVE